MSLTALLIAIADAATGTTLDYMKAVAGVKYSYTPELRATGWQGPLSRTEDIEPSFEENWAALVALANHIHEAESKKHI